MKRMKTTVLAALLLISGAAMASGNLQLSIIPEENNLKVNISNAEESRYEIEITDSRGNIFYYKVTKKPSSAYNSTYDYSTLRDGKYTYKVKLGEESVTAYLEIKKGKAAVVEQRKDLEPFFSVKDKQLNVSFLNFEREKLLIMVYDNQSNELLYKKGFDRDFAVMHALNLSKLDKGSYNAILSTQSQDYRYEVNIK
ncbi:hypothetical protein [Maribellus sediminis]|uniref:hypothetical protein n=1 Tax=Maribellus sediminis TaxID=2696285 RepID=UPI0014321212|nr:hypothetical protein [Maribellus sediminis]